MNITGNKSLSFFVAFTVAVILSMIQVLVDKPLLMLERFLAGGGWIEVVLLSCYSWFLANKMSSQGKQSIWRVRSWTIFSIFFFFQLIFGILVDGRFLMSGELHLPVPMMIIAGPIYRLQISFMPVLFLSTIALSGPAWCSQLCYMGAVDAQFSRSRSSPDLKGIISLKQVRFTILAIVIISAILLRLFNIPTLYTTIIAGSFGLAGLVLMIRSSRKSGQMIHCISYCPVGTIIAYLKFINPFRFRIAESCTSCYRCIPECKYGALTRNSISKRKPGISCTLCGDCIDVCKPKSLHYKLPGLGPEFSRYAYLGITITLHAIFMGMARI